MISGYSEFWKFLELCFIAFSLANWNCVHLFSILATLPLRFCNTMMQPAKHKNKNWIINWIINIVKHEFVKKHVEVRPTRVWYVYVKPVVKFARSKLCQQSWHSVLARCQCCRWNHHGSERTTCTVHKSSFLGNRSLWFVVRWSCVYVCACFYFLLVSKRLLFYCFITSQDISLQRSLVGLTFQQLTVLPS